MDKLDETGDWRKPKRVQFTTFISFGNFVGLVFGGWEQTSLKDGEDVIGILCNLLNRLR